ncbi:hypothetical protein COY95_01550, partial [Candidatus Woesearchaeota archaeon CG_4_10_14_0_8_um_filter_47_5]
MREYGHTQPVFVIDGSDDENALPVAQGFRDRLEIHYVGLSLSKEMAQDLSKNLKISEDYVLRIIRGGYGGTRNAGMLVTLNDIVVSIDDDIDLRSFHPQNSEELLRQKGVPGLYTVLHPPDFNIAYSGRPENQIVGFSLFGQPNVARPVDYDVFGTMTHHLGETVGHSGLPCAYTLSDLT